MPPTTGLVLASVSPERAGASAGFNTFRQVGGALAIAIFGGFIADRERFVAGMQVSLTIAASLSVITALVSLRIRSSRESAS
jgi:MFS transporter, DHA2 family, methylenomycin A resistance protein